VEVVTVLTGNPVGTAVLLGAGRREALKLGELTSGTSRGAQERQI
jgi:hypothetical protein